ncbi:hypothetical protein C2G38_2196229 [Gigaspora rosea]|uniref:Uncharacterized protein n=1 Tax=Gigaspora rosea TaxID=44941 RepID=A0A397UZ54_9GLOM|nr:hypothetical protein C2G38_2196229 [Gigaspora rosea]
MTKKRKDDYIFAIYNYKDKNKDIESKIDKGVNKKVPCKIDVEMSEPSGKDNSWDSDNETLVGGNSNMKDSKIKDACNKVWKERVVSIQGTKLKKFFQSQEALDKACEVWLEKVSSFKQGSSYLLNRIKKIARTLYSNWLSQS